MQNRHFHFYVVQNLFQNLPCQDEKFLQENSELDCSFVRSYKDPIIPIVSVTVTADMESLNVLWTDQPTKFLRNNLGWKTLV